MYIAAPDSRALRTMHQLMVHLWSLLKTGRRDVHDMRQAMEWQRSAVKAEAVRPCSMQGALRALPPRVEIEPSLGSSVHERARASATSFSTQRAGCSGCAAAEISLPSAEKTPSIT